MAPAAPLASLIAGLAEASASERERAAREIFRLASELAGAATARWFADPELAACFALDDSGHPALTVGLAVERPAFARIRAANASPPLAAVPPEHDAVEFELAFPGEVRLDILSTRRPGESGAMAQYLRRFGPGIQQVELSTRHLEKATELLRARFDLQPVYPGPRPGADATQVNFFLVPAPEGRKLLIELVEEERPSA